MTRALLLDADGVVIKNHEYFSARYKRDFGSSLDDDAVSNFFKTDYKKTSIGKKDLKDLLESRLEKWGWSGTVDELLKYWFEGERELDQEVLTEIDKLRSRGIKCYLASDNEKYRAEYLLDEVGMRNKFDDIFFSCYLGFTKSDPEFFMKVIKQLELKAEEIMYLDDDPKNVEVAKTLGVDARIYNSISQLHDLTLEV